MNDFDLQSYDYFLPPELIATHPANPRSSARLLVYHKDTRHIEHFYFRDFCEIVPRDYILVCNDTKVIKARIYAYKEVATQKKMEILFHKQDEAYTFLVQIRGKVKVGEKLRICDKTNTLTPIVVQVQRLLDNGLRVVSFHKDKQILGIAEVFSLLESYGHIPLPPYIKREDTPKDIHDYQSVFAKNIGAIAAPTASLHFSKQDFATISALYNTCFVTLHVGAGTFTNVESSDIRAHTMHAEHYAISSKAIRQLNNPHTKLLCIGTTSARVVEYYYRTKNSQGLCDLFLHPANKPQRMNALLTNFHFPKSTLLMLVSAFIGRKETLRIYQCAIEKGYKFYSYGDGMVVL